MTKTQLPFDIIKYILKFQEEWWLKPDMTFINISKIKDIPIPYLSRYNGSIITINLDVIPFFKIYFLDYWTEYNRFGICLQINNRIQELYISTDRYYWINCSFCQN